MRTYLLGISPLLMIAAGCQINMDDDSAPPIPPPPVAEITPTPASIPSSHPPVEVDETPVDGDETSEPGEDENQTPEPWVPVGYDPGRCVTMWQALALDQVVMENHNTAYVELTNLGDTTICVESRPLFSSLTSQTALIDPSVELGGATIEPGETLELVGRSHTSGSIDPASDANWGWWCLERTTSATANSVFTSIGEAPPPSLDSIATDFRKSSDQRQEEIWVWQDEHAVLTSAKYLVKRAGGVEVHLASRNAGLQGSTGLFEDVIPPGFAVSFPQEEPDEISLDEEGNLHVFKEVEPFPGGGNDTWVEFVYFLSRPGPSDEAYLELAPVLLTFDNTDRIEYVQSLPAAAFEVDFNGDGSYSATPLEICDGVDNNNDGSIDEGFDQDDDGVTVCMGDCDDHDSGIYPDITQDEDGETITTQIYWRDMDEDGFASDQYGDHSSHGTTCNPPAGYLPRDVDAIDCDDRVDSIWPGAPETCNNRDDDCNTLVDDGIDNDGDGAAVCDCDDANAMSSPSGTEIPLDGIDNDCDGHDAGLIQVAAGMNHSLALDNEGHVWAWGDNFFGQLGDGTPDNRSTPVQVVGLSKIVEIAAGWNHSLAIDSSGDLWAWGSNSQGQLGIATTIDAHRPTRVGGVAGVEEVAGGAFHTVMVTSTGEVWTWGENNSGQLGNGTTLSSMVPLKVPNFTRGAHVAAGESHTLVAKVDGTVEAWGANDSGQLGDGSSENHSRPVSVEGLTGVLQVAAGARHSLARLDNGWVRAWGSNYQGQLGNGTQVPTTLPVWTQVESIVDLSAGATHSIAMDRWGQVFTFGDNDYGQIGANEGEIYPNPVQIEGLTAVDVAAGGKHSLALQDLLTLFAWGDNSRGQLGTTITGSSSIPTEVVLPYPTLP